MLGPVLYGEHIPGAALAYQTVSLLCCCLWMTSSGWVHQLRLCNVVYMAKVSCPVSKGHGLSLHIAIWRSVMASWLTVSFLLLFESQAEHTSGQLN